MLAGLYVRSGGENPEKLLENTAKGEGTKSWELCYKREKENRELPETKYEKWLCIRGQVSAGPFQKPLETICVSGHRFKGLSLKVLVL